MLGVQYKNDFNDFFSLFDNVSLRVCFQAISYFFTLRLTVEESSTNPWNWKVFSIINPVTKTIILVKKIQNISCSNFYSSHVLSWWVSFADFKVNLGNIISFCFLLWILQTILTISFHSFCLVDPNLFKSSRHPKHIITLSFHQSFSHLLILDYFLFLQSTNFHRWTFSTFMQILHLTEYSISLENISTSSPHSVKSFK